MTSILLRLLASLLFFLQGIPPPLCDQVGCCGSECLCKLIQILANMSIIQGYLLSFRKKIQKGSQPLREVRSLLLVPEVESKVIHRWRGPMMSLRIACYPTR